MLFLVNPLSQLLILGLIFRGFEKQINPELKKKTELFQAALLFLKRYAKQCYGYFLGLLSGSLWYTVFNDSVVATFIPC